MREELRTCLSVPFLFCQLNCASKGPGVIACLLIEASNGHPYPGPQGGRHIDGVLTLACDLQACICRATLGSSLTNCSLPQDWIFQRCPLDTATASRGPSYSRTPVWKFRLHKSKDERPQSQPAVWIPHTAALRSRSKSAAWIHILIPVNTCDPKVL